MRRRVLLVLLLSLSAARAAEGPPAAPAEAVVPDAAAFPGWLAAFRTDAIAQGIKPETYEAAFAGAQPVERVIELDRRQPEFLQTFAEYFDRRVTPSQIARGETMLAEHAALLDAVEAQYGVPKTVLVAFWGLETRYGAYLGSFNIPLSLATLAWEGRRSAFFKSQLIDALRIVDAGHVAAADMNGSWAGAMGQMQFMPSTFRAYALDGDGDGRIDLWNSLPDALHSAAHYLKRAGWRTGEPAAREVRLPADFDWRQARITHRVPLADWIAAGVVPADGGAWPSVAGPAAIVLPQGWQGPAFMVFDNFDVVMRWNRSVNYALAVAQLANRLAGGVTLVARAGEAGALSTAQVRTMQHYLNTLGFDTGTPDGLMGPRTQSALRRFQAAQNLPADGYPSPSVYARIEAVHETADRLSLAPSATLSDPPSGGTHP